ncbi:ceramidase domain-containing protein [Nocardioides sp. YIM 152315]|uniref:ceramidase domain-containing protein n=1 Tax=Nocardioides sp. YIM 152315 TaxID=3031760 RepID=UPI0023DC24BC|nr:ceramidase domain-containing protein [Nocardioides sp. YIM 152315]MDF1603689.1 ceramidase domain-containing protein [Nocardioides sp. YIM 152315]
MSRSFRPLAYAAATAVVSTGLLVLAVRHGWLGDDVGRGANFCEAARDGLVKQPANSFSNLGFVVAGLLVAWRAGRPDRLGDVLPRHAGLATAYGCVVVLLGPASAAMHATQSDLGGDLDMVSMYLVASFAAAYALMRRVGQGRLFFWQLFSLFVAACELVGLYDGAVPVVTYSGNLAFAALLLTAVVVEAQLWRRPRPTRTDLRWGAAALGTILVAFAVWSLTKSRWCDPHSLVQGHAAWHLLDAVSAYLLFRFWISERDPARP